ncbi:EscI/YscI/HrpB family type III secretion system inner rod protein [Yersinia enterocolitica]|uniref:EscI/YscI/HrpB family type III secretion system inner rod protein n=1 Tax=Yersinia TaxID=629 RepID=UPI000B6DF01B|nr:EscI/YscI/HrpB family type III secretion system inner rod protein [Yersinia kristensenii]MBW5817946.1 EscI/YscI/HrpB family type III secretion system inner rod protein [Yersinia kristensenii]MBW5829869.1 EscI/YscI/HrpB family type III secretion system inner rod protein [Yersinia kristensenii]MBW5842262.1 EscI/YscI/HrpB family type III secretion system inner rod protein [Yersinia kristensenii]MDA5490277.1 EscI/YscI/HrpB family type III secretion system inner rod protein [Yersinia kristensenii
MNDFAVTGIENSQVSILENTVNNIGEGFKEIMEVLNDVNSKGGNITVIDTLSLQQAMFKFTMHQEIVTKIASKSVSAINDVMKAQ